MDLTDFQTVPDPAHLARGHFRKNLPKATRVKIPEDVKSGLYKTVKWGFSELSDRPGMAIKVPVCPETRALIKFLWKMAGPPGTSYFRHAFPVAWQWRLELPQWRKLWQLDSPRLGP